MEKTEQEILADAQWKANRIAKLYLDVKDLANSGFSRKDILEMVRDALDYDD